MKKLIFLCFIIIFSYAVESNELLESSESSADSSVESITDSQDLSKIQIDSPKDLTQDINRNGVFAGFEAGVIKFTYKERGAVGSTNAIGEFGIKGAPFGIIGGYRYFFAPSVGIRGYASMNWLYKKNNDAFGELKMLTLGANADFLLNIFAHRYIDIGAFFGLFVGGDIYGGKALNRFRIQNTNNYTLHLSSLNVSLNMGFHTVIFNMIGLEFIAKIPLKGHYFINEGKEENSIIRQLSQNYFMGARVIYHF